MLNTGFSGCSARRCPISRCLDLQKRQPCVIEEDFPSRGERHAARLSLQQLHTDFGFQISNLPA